MADWWESDPVASATASGAATGADWWKKDPVAEPAKPESWGTYGYGLLEKAGQGATLGYGDEIAAGAGSVGNKIMRAVGVDVPERSYDQILHEVRGEQKQFEENHPYQGMGAEVAGGLAPLVAGPVRTVIAAPTWLGRVGRSIGYGSAFGGASGFGNSEGGVENRLKGGAEAAAVGAVAAPLLSDVALPVVSRLASVAPQAVRFAGKAMQSARDPEGAAYRNVADKGVQSGLDFNAMRARISPETSADLQTRGFTEDDIAHIISRQLAGEDAATVAADYAHLVNTKGQKFTAATAKEYLKKYRDSNPTPLNVLDVARLVGGEGGSAPLSRYGRAVQTIGGAEDGSAAQALIGRQELQPGRVGAIIEKRMGAGDFEANKAANAQLLKQESDKAYTDFYKEPDLATDKLGDLMEDPLFQKAVGQAQEQTRVEIIRRNQDAIAKGLPEEPVPYSTKNDPQFATLNQELREAQDNLTAARRQRQDAKSKDEKRMALEEARLHEDTITSINREIKDLSKTNNETFSPEFLDRIQRQLRIAGEGFANPNEARHAQNLRQVFLSRIEQHYPTFKGIRETYASGKVEQDAFDFGVKLSTRLGANTRETLAAYDKMTPAQQAIVRESYGSALRDQTAGTVSGAQAANKFTSDSFKQIIGKLYPKSDKKLHEDGQKLIRELLTEAVTTRTKNFQLSGSITAEKLHDQDLAGTAGEAAAQAFTGQYLGVLRTLGKRLSQQIGSQGAKQSLKILTETDPAKLLPILTRLAEEAKTYGERQAYVASIRELRAGAFAGANPAIGMEAGKQNAVSGP